MFTTILIFLSMVIGYFLRDWKMNIKKEGKKLTKEKEKTDFCNEQLIDTVDSFSGILHLKTEDLFAMESPFVSKCKLPSNIKLSTIKNKHLGELYYPLCYTKWEFLTKSSAAYKVFNSIILKYSSLETDYMHENEILEAQSYIREIDFLFNIIEKDFLSNIIEKDYTEIRVKIILDALIEYESRICDIEKKYLKRIFNSNSSDSSINYNQKKTVAHLNISLMESYKNVKNRITELNTLLSSLPEYNNSSTAYAIDKIANEYIHTLLEKSDITHNLKVTPKVEKLFTEALNTVEDICEQVEIEIKLANENITKNNLSIMNRHLSSIKSSFFVPRDLLGKRLE